MSDDFWTVLLLGNIGIGVVFAILEVEQPKSLLLTLACTALFSLSVVSLWQRFVG